MRKSSIGKQNGQAMLEFIAALVVLLIITTGLFHINRMARSSLFLHSVLRAKAGKKAMSTATLADAPELIKDWQPGPDGLTYTADDKMEKSSAILPSTLHALTRHSTENQSDDAWQYVSRHSRLPVSMKDLHETAAASTLLGIVREEETLLVPVEPVIRDLVYDKDEVQIREGVAMPLMGGLY